MAFTLWAPAPDHDCYTSPIRVLIVAPSTDILGGQAVQAARLVDNLSDERSVEIGFLPVNPRLRGRLRKLQSIRYLRTVVTSLVYVATLISRVRKYDVIHIFSASYLSFVLAPTPAILIARLFRKKVLLNYRSGECEDHLRRWPSARAVIRLAHRIVVPSGYLVEVFARFGIRAHPIANIVDLSSFVFRERRPLRPILLSNRNLESLYNVEAVLYAFALIQSQVPGARLIVAGDGSHRAGLRELAVELELRNVEFTGAVQPALMHSLHRRADILINASNIDNMPVSIIEAFASGLAVVTTDAGGIPHIVTHEQNGLLVSRGDWEALAVNVLRLLRDQVLADRLVATARDASRQYTWNSVRSLWLATYCGLAGWVPVEAAQPEAPAESRSASAA